MVLDSLSARLAAVLEIVVMLYIPKRHSQVLATVALALGLLVLSFLIIFLVISNDPLYAIREACEKSRALMRNCSL